MILQKVLKGIAGITDTDAQDIFAGAGITCNWWRNADEGELPVNEIPDRLNEYNLFRHLNDYPVFGSETPFISTTAGGVERDAANAINLRFSAFITALGFATNHFTTSGAIFYGYVNVLGKKSIKMEEFAEETRELNIWHDFQPYHREGEIVAKIAIPPAHLEKAEIFDGPTALRALLAHQIPLGLRVSNPRYVPPTEICNIRDVIDL